MPLEFLLVTFVSLATTFKEDCVLIKNPRAISVFASRRDGLETFIIVKISSMLCETKI